MIRPFVLAAVMLLTPPASAHDWYPQECCSNGDCRPLDPITERVETHAAGYDVWFWWQEGIGTAHPGPLTFVHDFVPVNKARWSKDNQFHLCPFYYEQGIKGRDKAVGAGKRFIRCLFRPPPNM